MFPEAPKPYQFIGPDHLVHTSAVHLHRALLDAAVIAFVQRTSVGKVAFLAQMIEEVKAGLVGSGLPGVHVTQRALELLRRSIPEREFSQYMHIALPTNTWRCLLRARVALPTCTFAASFVF